MFRIKSKSGCNLTFNNPKIPNLNSSNNEWTYIDDDIFNNSTEIKQVLNFLVFEQVESIETKEELKINNNIIEAAENIFVHNGHDDVHEPDQINTFAIRAPEDEVKKEEIKVVETKIVEVEQETLVVEPIEENVKENFKQVNENIIKENTESVIEVKKRGRKPKVN